MLSALHTISSYPPDLADPVFAHYPAMKFGHRQSVDRFADMLVPLAVRMVTQSQPPVREWVLTSPSLRGLPCGANLVCRALHPRLCRALPDGFTLDFEAAAHVGPWPQIQDAAEFEQYGEYSKQSVEVRRAIRLGIDRNIAFDAEKIRGRGVIYFNDINVTGAQMERTKAVYAPAQPEALHWLLIVNVEAGIGRRFPHVENEINRSGLAELDAFVSFLQTADLQYTGKLVSRLLAYDAATLERIFRSLDPFRRRGLRQAILDEDRYGSAFFEEKLQVVDRAALSA
jgi:hypothetical protein